MKKKSKNPIIVICGVFIATILFFNSAMEMKEVTLSNPVVNDPSGTEIGAEISDQNATSASDLSGLPFKIFFRNLPYLNNK